MVNIHMNLCLSNAVLFAASNSNPGIRILADPLLVANSARASSATFTEHFRRHHGACRIDIDGTENAEASVGCVDIFELAGTLAIVDHTLVVHVEGHLLRVGTDELRVVNIAIVVQGLVDDGATLGEDAVCVCVPAVVIDRIENVIG